MFDTHRHVTERVYERQDVTVTEKRAPTDESVRLLREFEKAARDKIATSIRLENSPIDCVIYLQADPMNSQREFVAFVQINGKRVEVRKSFGWHETSLDKIAQGLLAAVSEAMVSEFLAPALVALQRQIGGFL